MSQQTQNTQYAQNESQTTGSVIPFEGINETINIYHRDIICKIDDFRKLTLWKQDAIFRRSFWPKDAGHRLAILQPYQTDIMRDWDEVIRSTLLMLQVTDMVRKGKTEAVISMTAEMKKIEESAQLT